VNAVDLFDDELVLSLFSRFPLVLVYLAAIVAAIVTWRRHPRASALALCGALILLFAGGLEFFWEFLLFDVIEIDEMIDFIDVMMLWVTPLVQAFGMALLVAAIFVGRRTPQSRNFGDDD
jgi:hypothetical protein